jgi:YaiO family outer membrane protein
MKRLLPLLALVAASLVPQCGAAEPLPLPVPVPSATPAQFTDVEAGGANYGVTNNRGAWNNAYLYVDHQFEPRGVVYASAMRDSRFGFTDPQYVAGAYAPLGNSTILNVEASFSPTHNVDPNASVLASLEQRLANGWGTGVSQRYRNYTEANAQTTGLFVDRYWSNYRAAFYINGTSLTNVPGLSVSQTGVFTRYFGNATLSSLTLSVSTGRDVENVGTGIVASSVFQTDVSGTGWLDGRSALTWDATYQHFGNLYTRTGLSLGYRRRY